MTSGEEAPRVLLVDDDSFDRQLVRGLLAEDFSILEATRASEGLEILRSEPLDCVLIDYRLPDHDGVTLLPYALDRQLGAVMLTGMSGETPAVASLRAGAHDYVSKKELSRESLARAIRNAIEKAHLSRELQLYKEIVERMPIGAAVAQILHTTGPDRYRFLTANAAHARAVGRPVEHFVGRMARDCLPEHVESGVIELYGKANESGRPQALPQITRRGRDQTEIWDVQVVPLSEDRVLLLSEDVSQRERARAERERMEMQMRAAQRLEAVGRLAAGVAHDFNNLLTVIQGYTGFLREEMEPDDSRRSDLDHVSEAAQRGTRLVRQLLAFSRRQVQELRVQNINEIVTSIEDMLQRVLGEDVHLCVRADPDLGVARVDTTQIEQVLMNLVVNARDAMPQGGRVTVETGNVEVGEEYGTTRGMAVRPGPYVMLAVSDTGLGMDEETRSQIFEPFFTTKGRNKGTGLGLSTVYGIVKQSGGFIWVYSEPGAGSTFRVYLPQAQGKAETAGRAQGPLTVPRGDETILLVEDDDLVRDTAERILTRQGYTVLAAGHPDQAVELFERSTDSIDLLLTDMVMPDSTGKALADRILQRRPDLPVVFMSGYTDGALDHNGVLLPGTTYLQKPFTSRRLLQTIREGLSRARLSKR